MRRNEQTGRFEASSDFMELEIVKGDGWIADIDGASVVLYDWDAPAIDRLRTQIGEKMMLEEQFGTLNSVEYVRGYFGRYSAPGYLDCTDWMYDTNKRRLEKDMRAMYDDTMSWEG